MNLSYNVKITKVANYSSANTTAVTSSEIDMQGFDGVMFLTTIAVANAGNYLKVQQDTVTGMASAADLTGTKVVCTGSNEVIGCDVYKPLERFVRAVVTRTASTACGEIYAIQYNGRIKPCDNITAGTINVETHISPAEGTA